MITCSTCGFANGLTSSYCRQCGAKLVMGAAQLQQAVATTDALQADDRALASGRSSIGMAAFLLVVAAVVRFAVVPAMPPADLPVPDLGPAIPAVAASSAAQPAAAPTTAATPLGLRVTWRGEQGGHLLATLSLDRDLLGKRVDALVALQQPDGGFTGPDRVASTALHALGIAAFPHTAAARRALGRALAWLKTHDGEGLGRALRLIALIDSQAIAAAELNSQIIDLLDGAVPQMQALALALLPPADRPQRLAALRAKLTGPVWGDWFDLVGGAPFAGEVGTYVSERAARETGGECVAWATIAWKRGLQPDELVAVLRNWSGVASLPPEPALADIPDAAAILALMAATAPIRHLPLDAD